MAQAMRLEASGYSIELSTFMLLRHPPTLHSELSLHWFGFGYYCCTAVPKCWLWCVFAANLYAAFHFDWDRPCDMLHSRGGGLPRPPPLWFSIGFLKVLPPTINEPLSTRNPALQPPSIQLLAVTVFWKSRIS